MTAVGVAVFVVVVEVLNVLGTMATVRDELSGNGMLPSIGFFLVSPYGTAVLLVAVLALLFVHRSASDTPQPFDASHVLGALSPTARALLAEVPEEGWISVSWTREDEASWRSPRTVYRPSYRVNPHEDNPEIRLRELHALEDELVGAGLVVDEQGLRRAYCPTLQGWEVARILARSEQLEIEREHGQLSDAQFSLLRAMSHVFGHDLPRYLQSATGRRDWSLVDFAGCWQSIPDGYKLGNAGPSKVGRQYIRARGIAERTAG